MPGDARSPNRGRTPILQRCVLQQRRRTDDAVGPYPITGSPDPHGGLRHEVARVAPQDRTGHAPSRPERCGDQMTGLPPVRQPKLPERASP